MKYLTYKLGLEDLTIEVKDMKGNFMRKLNKTTIDSEIYNLSNPPIFKPYEFGYKLKENEFFIRPIMNANKTNNIVIQLNGEDLLLPNYYGELDVIIDDDTANQYREIYENKFIEFLIENKISKEVIDWKFKEGTQLRRQIPYILEQGGVETKVGDIYLIDKEILNDIEKNEERILSISEVHLFFKEGEKTMKMDKEFNSLEDFYIKLRDDQIFAEFIFKDDSEFAIINEIGKFGKIEDSDKTLSKIALMYVIHNDITRSNYHSGRSDTWKHVLEDARNCYNIIRKTDDITINKMVWDCILTKEEALEIRNNKNISLELIENFKSLKERFPHIMNGFKIKA